TLHGVARASFLFSRRRRHTSFSRDWSSDVCSSDLKAQQEGAPWPESLFLEVQGAYDRLHEEVERMRSRLIDEPVVPAVDQFADEPVDTSEPAPVTLATPIVAASTQAPVVSGTAKVLPFIRRAEQAA